MKESNCREESRVVVICSGRVEAQVSAANTFWSKFMGLMGRDVREGGDGLFLVNCPRVHTCFMRCPIDVLYVGNGLQGIEVETLKPWRLGKKVKDARHVLEMPAGFFADAAPTSIRLVRI